MATNVTSESVKQDIDDYCLRAYSNGHRKHLGASLIGHDCARHLWYVFRWAKREQFSARMLRLFQRGHLEEARFIEYLRGAGWEVSDATPTGEQHRISDVMGHFGGSLDGIARPEEKLHAIEDDADAFLLECKTSGTGARFKALSDVGVRRAKPQHWAQMCVYGVLKKLKKAIYVSACKNDDDLHCEVVELDWSYGEELVGRAGAIILSQTAPERLAQSPAFHVCKFCHHKGICFDGAAMEKSCRSCRHANPIADAQWHCAKWGNTIPEDFIATGCDAWEQID